MSERMENIDSCVCLATFPAQGCEEHHVCKLPKGHTGWHTCYMCGWNWTSTYRQLIVGSVKSEAWDEFPNGKDEAQHEG